MADTLQIKLSMDPNLKKTWDFLNTRYSALDKASIIRLALNELVVNVKKIEPKDMLSVLEATDNEMQEGMTEEEAYEWWNENKKELRSSKYKK